MKCQKERCYSPVACNSFGYCRERNFEFPDARLISEETKKRWQKEDDND